MDINQVLKYLTPHIEEVRSQRFISTSLSYLNGLTEARDLVIQGLEELESTYAQMLKLFVQHDTEFQAIHTRLAQLEKAASEHVEVQELARRLHELDKYILSDRLLPLENKVQALQHAVKDLGWEDRR